MTAESSEAPSRSAEMEGWPLAYLQHVEGLVAFGDTKAGLLLTADAILLTGLGVGAERLELEGVSAVLAVVAAFILVAGLCAVLVAIAPSARHFAVSRRLLGKRPPAGRWFQFRSVKTNYKNDPAGFATAIVAQSPESLERDVLEAICGKSVFLSWKFGWLLAGVLLTLGSVIVATAAGMVTLLSP